LATTLAAAAVVLAGLLAFPGSTRAGIYNASGETTYKEYWVSHKSYTGTCLEDGSPEKPFGNSFYIEPTPKCDKVLQFDMPDDFANAAKIEIYIDLWRGYDSGGLKFKLNNSATIRQPAVGYDWSRTPYITEIGKDELNVGANTITFYGPKRYHVHDVAFRVYYDNNNPLQPGPGSDVTPPDGALVSVQDDNSTEDTNAGGTLQVNSNQLKLTANVSGDVAYVEFHAWYEGYDDDNDGIWRDWHNVNRNNWNPGGTTPQELGGTINHIGTVKPKDGVATATWDLTHVVSQPQVRFKIRVVDAAGNVRDAAGGQSANFKLVRNTPTLAIIIPTFDDFGLHMSGEKPQFVDYDFNVAANTADFDTGYLVGMYWRRPLFSINGSGTKTVNPGPDEWMLGVQTFNYAALKTGKNRITYSYSGSGVGHFIEKPGPMFVLRRSSGTVADVAPPFVSGQNPAPNATNVDPKAPVVLNVNDLIYGVDWTSIQLTVNGQNVGNQLRIDGVNSSYKLTYDPSQGLEYDQQYNLGVNACDNAGNCMNQVNYSFTTAEPDTTPPVISNVVVDASPVGARVTWTTNEAATSRVDYGPTAAYELGNVSLPDLVVNHTIDLAGLTPDTLYHYRVTSVDAQGNQKKTDDLTFRTDEFGTIVSDDFNACSLNPLWTFVNPLNDADYTMNGTQLRLTVPAGKSHDFKAPSIPPRILQPAAAGNFNVYAKFDTLPTAQTQLQGIIVQQDAQNYVYASLEYTLNNGVPELIVYNAYVQNNVRVKAFKKSLAGTTAPLLLRLERTGDNWRVYTSPAGNPPTWTAMAAAHTFVITPIQVGLFAGNSGGSAAPAYTSVVDYFFNAASPIEPEDGTPLSVDLSTAGNGTATKTPDLPSYVCGAEVAINATPAVGWNFTGWSGDFNSTNASETVVIDGPKSITANFTAIPYTLSINVANQGTGGDQNKVEKDPDKETYVYNDVVNLTAVPQPGWTFVSWSGAVTGPELSKSLTMRKDESVTATFKQEQYTLNLQVVNNGIGSGGTTTVTPNKPAYVYGDVVELKAEPKPGWKFDGWSGAVNSTALTVEYTVTGNASVTATYTQELYDLNIQIISGGVGEGGVVLKNPDKSKYVYGDVVALIADPNCGWTFTEWGGALSGNNPVEVVNITGNTNVTAKFTQEKYKLKITLDGPGNVAVSPKKDDYYCGDVVTLTAVPAVNYFFGGWSGDLTGAQNPVDYTIEGNTNITARFTDNPPPTVTPIDDKTIRVNKLLTINVSATDIGSESLTLTAEGLPEGASFVDKGKGAGVFTWKPGVAQTGDYSVTFIASDGNSIGSATVNIKVTGNPVVLPVIVGP
jgi:regulation of enolase protein 1 (concanavalin A-like superfamily)